MKTSAKRIFALLICFVCVLQSCYKECETPVVSTGTKLVEADELGTHTVAEMKLLILASGTGISTDLIKYDVKVYRVKYHTTFKGDDVIASGVVVIPQTNSALSMLSVHHGTIVLHSDAPSAQGLGSEQILLYSGLASTGFVTVVPDYLGFGNSSYVLHPYYVEDAIVTPVVDNLKATVELMQNKAANFSKKLFLTGYSQGGYVTMAVHKFLDQNVQPEFILAASFPAAGGYDIKKFQEYLFTQTTYSNPYYLAYISNAYKNTFDWKEPLSDLFKESYAEEIPGLFFGDTSDGDINRALSDTLSVFLNPNFIHGVDTAAHYKYIADALRANSLTDWFPTTPMYMYHGDADTTVPYQNSVDVYNQLLTNGASQDVLHFITLLGADHSSGVTPYVQDVIPKILSMNSSM